MTGERLFLPELDGAEIDVAKLARALERDRVFGATHVQIDLGGVALRNAEGGFVLLSKIDSDDDRAIDLGAWPNLDHSRRRHCGQGEECVTYIVRSAHLRRPC